MLGSRAGLHPVRVRARALRDPGGHACSDSRTPCPRRSRGAGSGGLGRRSAVSSTADLLGGTVPGGRRRSTSSQGVFMGVGRPAAPRVRAALLGARPAAERSGPGSSLVLVVVRSALGSLAGPRGPRGRGQLLPGPPRWLVGRARHLAVRALSASAVSGRSRFAAICMAAFTSIEFAVTLPALVPAGDVACNRAWWLESTAIPVQLLAMGFSVPFVVALWYYYRSLLRQEHPGSRATVVARLLEVSGDRRGVLRPARRWACYAATLIDRHADAGRARCPLGRAMLAAGGINPDRSPAQTATSADVGTKTTSGCASSSTLMTESER